MELAGDVVKTSRASITPLVAVNKSEHISASVERLESSDWRLVVSAIAAKWCCR